MKTLTQFTQPAILKTIGARRLTLLFKKICHDDLKIAGIALPQAEEETDDYFSSVAAAFARAGSSGPLRSASPLPSQRGEGGGEGSVFSSLPTTQDPPAGAAFLKTLLTLETAASLENQAALDDAVQRRLSCVSVSRHCALDRALELWFACPDELAPFAPLPDPPADSTTVPNDTTPHRSSEIKTQNSSARQAAPTPTCLAGASARETASTPACLTGQEFKNLPTDSSQIENHNSKVKKSPITPWPDPVDGKALLDELVQVFTGFVVLPKWAAEALSLFTLHTYAFQARDVTTYVGIESPVKRCGKTTLLTVLGELVHRPVPAANVSPASFFRAIQDLKPTLLIDEVDTFLKKGTELRGILNAGYTRKTAYVMRVANQASFSLLQSDEIASPTAEALPPAAGESTQPASSPSPLVRFSCWCPKVMATIGRLPDTVEDRSILIRMERKMHNEKCDRLKNLNPLPLKQKCSRFVQDHFAAIAAAEPQMSLQLNDRAADTWEPLLALADLAGGHWPQLARQAAVALSAAAHDSNPIGSLLLDIFVLFTVQNTNRLFTRQLLDGLNGFTDRPWFETNKGRPVTDLWLSRQLRPYGIQPKTIRIGEMRAKGYAKEDFLETCRRYVSRSDLDALRTDDGPSAEKSICPER